MIKQLTLIAALAASTAAADVTIGGSTVTLDTSGAPWVVDFRNAPTNAEADNGTYDLGSGVTVQFRWNALGGADEISVTPPPGYVAVPMSIAIEEGSAGRVHIFPAHMLGV
jgi:hypothetical protein